MRLACAGGSSLVAGLHGQPPALGIGRRHRQQRARHALAAAAAPPVPA
jgi:hypothetical protein